MTADPWLCELHQTWTTRDCQKCDDELIALDPDYRDDWTP